MLTTVECPSCGKLLERFSNETKNHKNTYTVFDLDKDIKVVICNNCGFAGSPGEFVN
jgi:predicted RNA-binding Zn-ribbon protein involved in translation (DUF1610 family)